MYFSEIRKRLFLSVALLLLLVLYAAAAREDLRVYVLAGAGAVVIFLLIRSERRVAYERGLAIKRLGLREDCDLGLECRIASEITRVDVENTSRLWEAAARFYEIPPLKVRAADRLEEVLDKLNDPDHDIYLSRVFLEGSCRRILRSHPPATWADLLGEIRRLEIECGICATRAEQRGEAVSHVLRQ